MRDSSGKSRHDESVMKEKESKNDFNFFYSEKKLK